MKKRLLMLLALLFLPLTACNNGGDNKGKEPVVNTVELDKTSATMKVGEELTLKATTNVEDPVLAWSTSNAQVALVNEGLVTAISSGEADILVQVRGKGISAKCAITVLDATFINLSYEELVLEVGEKETIGFETNSKEEITWKVEKEDIIKINNKNESNIEIEALAVGESDITATVEGKSASCHVIVNTPITYLSVTEALAIAREAGEEGTKDRQFVTGIIKTVNNPMYGEMYITDGENDLYIYGLYSEDGSIRYDSMEDKPYAGDEIYVSGILKTYKDSPEMGSAWLQKYISHQDEIDVSDYNEMNIATAREKEEGEKILLNGVVSFITYANGMKPQGIYLVDNTGSIYVYSVDIAGRVKIGDKVTVAGVKTYYILESEQGYAATYGYKGSCQLNGDYLVNISAHEQEFDKSWIQESTVKDILETSVGENITTSIFKVNAFINKVPGSGFVNYYINDLDNKTGSYCYSSNNGSDFAYLSQYDGKVCTVYLSPINCKATKSGAYFRFIPVLVEDDGFTFDEDYASEFAIEYYVKDQFQSLYNSDPSLEVIESVSNEDFNLENIPVSYSSSNTELLNFVKEDNKLIMHVYEGTGEVEVTLSASYKTVEYSEVIKINVDVTPIGFEYIGVKEAIDTEDGQEVIVHGIVASSLINQTGFYLADDTGIIAVRTDSTTIKNISLGNEVYMKGVRKHIVKDGSSNVGQSCIDNATLELNLFGNTPYSDASFIKNMSLTELLTHKNDQATVDMTAQAYVVKGHITKVASSYSTNYYVSTSDKYEASTSFYLYAGSGSQYAAYDGFVGAGEVTITLALCDWNTKNEYRACLICVASETPTVINGYNFK